MGSPCGGGGGSVRTGASLSEPHWWQGLAFAYLSRCRLSCQRPVERWVKNQGAGEDRGQEPHLCCLPLLLGAWDRSDRKWGPSPSEGFRAGEEGHSPDSGWGQDSFGGDGDKNNNIAVTLRGGQAGKSLDFGAQPPRFTSWMPWTRSTPL